MADSFVDVANYDDTRFEARRMCGAGSDEGWACRQYAAALAGSEQKTAPLSLHKFKEGGFTLRVAIKNLDATHATTAYNVYSGIQRGAGTSITGATKADPCVITSVAHGRTDLDLIIISGVKGMAEINNKVYTVKSKTTDTFELADHNNVDVSSEAFKAYISGGNVQQVIFTSCKNAITWVTVTNPAILAAGTDAQGYWNQIAMPDIIQMSATGNASASQVDTEIEIRAIRTLPSEQGAAGGY